MILDLYQLEDFLKTDNPVHPWEFVGEVLKLLAYHKLDITINNYVASKRVPDRCSIVIYEEMTQLVDCYIELSESMTLPKAIVKATLEALKKA